MDDMGMDSEHVDDDNLLRRQLGLDVIVDPSTIESTPQIERTLTLDEKYKLARVHLTTIKNGIRRGGFALPREHFDPSDRKHLESYRTFLTTGSWGNILFHQEYPYDSVIETVTRKFAIDVLNHMLSH